MASLRNEIRARAARALLSEEARNLRHRAARIAANVKPGARRIHYVHRVDDPYCSLMLQVVRRLRATFEVEVQPILAPLGPADVAPCPDQAEAYALLDCARFAQLHDVEFPSGAQTPHPDAVAEANAVLARAVGDGARFWDVAERVDRALWWGDAMPSGATTGRRTRRVLATGDRLRRRLGHYGSAMLYDGAEWYWGPDRVDYLVDALVDGGYGARTALVRRRPGRLVVDGFGEDPEVEFFFSFRSPYSYLAAQTAFDAFRRAGARVRIRAVLPMVMRGLAVPRVKRLYILQDVAREAQQLGLPFGYAVDPVGAGVERCMAVLHVAEDRREAFVRVASRAIFSEATDVATDEGLRRVCERSGVPWETARAALTDDAWRAEAEANRVALFSHGLWGVPTFVCGDFAVWGRDRIWMMANALRANGARPLPTRRPSPA